VALVVGVEHEAEVALAGLADGEVHGPDQRSVEIARQHGPLLERPRDVALDRGPHLVLGARVSDEPACDVRARVDGVQPGDVAGHEPP
jgi:hypothetical protein